MIEYVRSKSKPRHEHLAIIQSGAQAESFGSWTTKMNLLVRLAHLIRSLYWRLVKPVTFGVKALIVNDAKEILLVQHTYGARSQWMLPGGSVRKGETAEAAIEREIREELGVSIIKKRVVGEFVSTQEGKTDNITLFLCDAAAAPNARGLEIASARFFARAGIPRETSPATRRRITEFFDNIPSPKEW